MSDPRSPDTDAVVAGLIRTVGLAPARVGQPTVLGSDPALPSVFRVGTAAAGCVGATLAAAAELWCLRGGALGPVRLGVREAAISFRSERYLRVGGRALELWDPLTGDYRAGDGRWVRLHCNYAHHRRAAVAALGAAERRPAVAAAVGSIPAAAAEERVVAAGGCAAMMRSLPEWRRHPQCTALAQLPLVDMRRLGGNCSGQPLVPAGRPLKGIRVLDLTRVIAGPVCGRVLASLGADVLRVGAGHLPDADLAVIDTGFGKRFCHLDLRTEPGREALRGLVRECDVLIQGYRPGALARLGFSLDAIAELRPGVVFVNISAYGGRGPWGAQRGFDSLVQMVTGIAHEGAAAVGVDGPRPLPAQALDHGTGWLAALGVLAALIRSREEGGSWSVELSLARTSQWLDELGRIDGLDARDPTAPAEAPRLQDLGASIAARRSLDQRPLSRSVAEVDHVIPPPHAGLAPPA